MEEPGKLQSMGLQRVRHERNEEEEKPRAGELTGPLELRVSLTRLQSQVSLS